MEYWSTGFSKPSLQNSMTSVTQLIDLTEHSRYLIVFRSASEPLAQAVEHLPFKQRVAGSNPARLTNPLVLLSSYRVASNSACKTFLRFVRIF